MENTQYMFVKLPPQIQSFWSLIKKTRIITVSILPLLADCSRKFLDTEEIVEALIDLPLVDSAQVKLNYFSNSIEITLKEMEPWHMLDMEGVGHLVTKQRKVIPSQVFLYNSRLQLVSSELPRITCGNRDCRGFSGFTIRRAWGFLAFIEKVANVDFLELRTSNTISAHIRSQKFEPATENSEQLPQIVWFSLTKPHTWSGKFLQYQLVAKDLAERGERLPVIDLRFEGQVIGKSL